MAANVNKFNKFVLSFLKDTSDSNNINELWMASDVQKQVKSLCALAAGSQGRKNKDPNAPKRGKSGYLFFCSENRDAVKASLGEHSKATDVTKELGLRWNALKESKKPADKKILAVYEKAAADDKARYQGEKAEYTPPDVEEDNTRGRRGKRKSAKKGPKRAKSGYLYFCEERRDQLKATNPNLKSTEITSELGRLWNELKADSSRAAELSKYEGKASNDKQRYETEKSDNVEEVKHKPPPKKEAVPAPKKGKKEEVVEDDDDVVDDDAPPPVKKGKVVPAKSAPAKSAPQKEPPQKEPPAKKLNGYQKYCESRRPELKAHHPNDKPADITKKLSDEWKSLSKEDKQKWD